MKLSFSQFANNLSSRKEQNKLMLVNIWRQRSSLKIDNLPEIRYPGWLEICIRSIYAEFDGDVSDSYVTLSFSGFKKTSINPK